MNSIPPFSQNRGDIKYIKFEILQIKSPSEDVKFSNVRGLYLRKYGKSLRVNLNFGSIVRGRAVVFLRHFRELFRQTAAWCSTVLKETFIIIFDTIINNEPKLGLMQCIKKGNIIESSSRNVFLKFQMGLYVIAPLKVMGPSLKFNLKHT